MRDPPDLLGLENVIFRHVDKGRVEARNGSIFICPLAGGSLRFLHELYSASDRNNRKELEERFGFQLPQDYLRFMCAWNGAILFACSLNFFGLVPLLNRGLTLEDAQPVSLESKLEISQVMHDPDYPWRPFGSVSGYEKLFRLELDASGRARMQWESGPERVANSVRGLVQPLAEFLGNLTDEHGFIDQTQRSMDAELSRFVETSH